LPAIFPLLPPPPPLPPAPPLSAPVLVLAQTSAASQDCASAAVTATASVASIIEFAIAAIPADRPAVAILSNVSRRGCFQAVLK
jgi:hypothetical protein